MTFPALENAFPKEQYPQAELGPTCGKLAVELGAKGKKGTSKQKTAGDHLAYDPMGKRLYTLKEAAKYLGRSEWGMRELIWAGKIPVVREVRKIFIDICDLNDFITRNKSVYH